MTGHGDVPMAVMAMKLGAVDFVEKPFAAATLVRSIRDALATCRPASTATYEIDGRLARLTGRERDVLEQLVEDTPEVDIAAALGVSPHTVRSHVKNLYAKLEVHSRAQAVRAALQQGLV